MAHSRWKFFFYELIMLPKALPTFSCQNSLPPHPAECINIISSDISHSSFNDDTKIQRVRSLLLYSWAFYIYKMYNIYFVSLHTTPSRLLEHLCSSFAYITKWFCLLLLLLRLYNHLILLSWWDEYKIILWSHPWGKQPRKKI